MSDWRLARGGEIPKDASDTARLWINDATKEREFVRADWTMTDLIAKREAVARNPPVDPRDAKIADLETRLAKLESRR